MWLIGLGGNGLLPASNFSVPMTEQRATVIGRRNDEAICTLS
jgi:hypothetical protein